MPNMKKDNLLLFPETREELQELAKKNGLSFTGYIRMVLMAHCREEKTKRKQ